jgi:ActR/RegA family two-component response regulator
MGLGGVLLLDDDDDLLATLGELITLMTGRRCVQAHSLEEIIAQRADALACGDAILDINLGRGRASGLDVYAWLRQQHFGGRIFFLTGHARSHPLVVRARALDGVEVHQKPIGSDELRGMLEGVRAPVRP